MAVVNFGTRCINQSLADLPPFQDKRNSIFGRHGMVIAVSSATKNYCYGHQVSLQSNQIYLEADGGVVFKVL